MIVVDGVAKEFVSRSARVTALEPIDLTINDGEFVSIIGPSGCGKSTFLRILAALEPPTSGSITMTGAMRSESPAGFVFQEPVLLPWLTARENVSFPLDVKRVAPAFARTRAMELLALVGLADFADSYPRTLSGGMRQRVAIARALSYDPGLLLMDEPFGALDLLTRDRLNDELLDIWSKTGKTIVLVTHSVEEAAYLSDRVVVMSARPGRIRQIYDVPLERPRNEATKLDARFHQLMAQLRRDLA